MVTRLADRCVAMRKSPKNHKGRHHSSLRFERLEDRMLLSITPVQGGTPNYYGPEPNWAYSPAPTVDPVTGAISGGIKKFVDALPGLGAAAANQIGQYISIAVPDQATYPGSDYYEIALIQYTEQLSSSLKPTTLRGYVQIETPANVGVSHHVPLFYPDGVTPILNAAGTQVLAVDPPEYLGTTIVSTANVPTRVKFSNYLPTGQGGDLFLPTDTTLMGAGAGPNMYMPMSAVQVGGVGATVTIDTMTAHNLSVGSLVNLSGFTPSTYNGEFRVVAVPDATHIQVTLKSDPGGPATVMGSLAEAYTQDRATLHLHGGLTPWISDGTPHQWTTPAGELTNYPKGVSVENVPDMPAPEPGSETFFYSNQQSARLMFYHDHAYGITRLNVYAGEAAGYLLTDAVEQDLITRGVLPDLGTPPDHPGQDVRRPDHHSQDGSDLAVYGRRDQVEPVDSARLHAESESERFGRHEPHGPLGLWPVLLAAVAHDQQADRPDSGHQRDHRRRWLYVASRCHHHARCRGYHRQRLHGHGNDQRRRCDGDHLD